jgi:hypothetical protein
MASTKKVKRVHICTTCKGNGYVKIACIIDDENRIHQCWDCDSAGEFYEYVEQEERVLN